jgi:uncharacterized cupin superfamily protein
MSRPGCVNILELPEEDRPRMLKAGKSRAKVRAVGNTAGLTRMGVWLRTVQPGDAGTPRHFHTREEEWAYVLSGTATLRIGPQHIAVREGSFAGFPPGPAPHHFIATGDRPLVLLEGGERRPHEDSCWYVDLGMRWSAGKLSKTDDAPPPELGELAQCVHVDEQATTHRQHPVDPGARRAIRDLSTHTGLQRQVVRCSRVAAGERSTAYHTHDHTDEWVYILTGRAEVRVGDARFEVGPGDFIAHPSGSAPHMMAPSSELEYLMGGMHDSEDVIRYPDAGVMKRHGQLTPIDKP